MKQSHDQGGHHMERITDGAGADPREGAEGAARGRGTEAGERLPAPGGAGRLPVGTLAVDTARDRVGVVMDHVGGRVNLRPLGGGREWDADPGRVRPADRADELRTRVREANAESRRGR
ncbi:hypothetical protein [Streptomyces sp. HB2AG]|uniref:hypothetical protein n=1 Tax=Streptomyces sp. HB2AG TaxID=2983400 RepID=UPI002E7C1DCB|nr:hypothetical protein [Streptomyces sp. HB2AG]